MLVFILIASLVCFSSGSDLRPVPEYEIDLKKSMEVLKTLQIDQGLVCEDFHRAACPHNWMNIVEEDVETAANETSAKETSTNESSAYETLANATSIRRDRRSVVPNYGQLKQGFAYSFRTESVDKGVKKLKTPWFEAYEQIQQGNWNGPEWVRKSILMQHKMIIECMEDYKKRSALDCEGRLRRSRMGSSLFKLSDLYFAEQTPEYQEAQNFTKALIPATMEAMGTLFENWKGLRNRSDIRHFDLSEIKIHVGFPPNFHKHMDAAFDKFPSDPKKYWKWNRRIKQERDADYETIMSGLFMYKNAYANMHFWLSPEVHFGGTSLLPPAFPMNVSYAILFGENLFVFFHEIGHAVEKFINDKVLKQKNTAYDTDAYDPFNHTTFDEFKRCVIQTYGSINLTLLDDTIDGDLGFRENFADVFGFQLMWKVYTNYYKDKDVIPVSEKFNLTKEQVLLASFTRNSILCREEHKDKGRMRMRMEIQKMVSHTLGPNRLNVLMMETPQFQETFGCPVGTRMNPGWSCVKDTNMQSNSTAYYLPTFIKVVIDSDRK